MCLKKRICLCEGLGHPASRGCVLYITSIYKTEIKNASPSSSERIYVFSFEASFIHYIIYDNTIYSTSTDYMYIIYIYISRIYQSGLVPLLTHTCTRSPIPFPIGPPRILFPHTNQFFRALARRDRTHGSNPADRARA